MSAIRIAKNGIDNQKDLELKILNNNNQAIQQQTRILKICKKLNF